MRHVGVQAGRVMGVRRLQNRDRVLRVARAHGTRVAAEWAGISAKTVVQLRKEVDGYDRGRGHPTKAELAAEAPRPTCSCPRCAVMFSPKVEQMLRERYSTTTISRVLDVPLADVRAKAADMRRRRQAWQAVA